MMSRVNASRAGAVVANADEETNQLLPRFPSLRPRGLTQWLLTVSAHSQLCLLCSRAAGVMVWTVDKNFDPTHLTIDYRL